VLPVQTQTSIVLFYQPYDPAGDKQFVLIMQTAHQLQMAETLTVNNAWQLDDTFGTEQFGFHLSSVVVANKARSHDARHGSRVRVCLCLCCSVCACAMCQQGHGQPIGFMIYSFDKGSSAEAPAVQQFLSCLLARCTARAAAIIIDKSDSERKGVDAAVAADQASFNEAGEQVKNVRLTCK
jgi:hypothetical protein